MKKELSEARAEARVEKKLAREADAARESLYDIGDFAVGHRVQAFHPWTLGVAHWATITKVGRTRLYVDWHIGEGPKFIYPRDVINREGARVSGSNPQGL